MKWSSSFINRLKKGRWIFSLCLFFSSTQDNLMLKNYFKNEVKDIFRTTFKVWKVYQKIMKCLGFKVWDIEKIGNAYKDALNVPKGEKIERN